jgi:CHAT domain-containing protein/TPR repeat protein
MSNEHVIYPAFAADLAKARQLDAQMKQQPRVAVALIQHYRKILARLPQDTYPEFHAFFQAQLGVAFFFLPEGNPASNFKQAIACYQQALHFFTPKTDPNLYATVQSYMGNAYSSLLSENREANLKRAMAAYEEAAHYWKPKDDPDGYAHIQYSLGQIYFDLPTKDREANLKRAIACGQEAVRFTKPEGREYILLQILLGNAHTHLQINPIENLKRALDFFQEALRLISQETMPLDYANAQLNLGVACTLLFLRKHTNADLERALACYQEAAMFFTPENGPNEYAKIQTNLGILYNLRLSGDRAVNLKQAITCFEAALQFWKPQNAPIDYAITRMNLGTTCMNLPTRRSGENFKQALNSYEKALPFLSSREMPREYARLQMNLGLACTGLARSMGIPIEERVSYVKRAITFISEALHLWSPQTAPLEYADGQSNLGATYTTCSQLVAEGREANLERARVCYHKALSFHTCEASPVDYATTQQNLALVYTTASNFSTGEVRENHIKQAIQCYQEALRLRTPEIAPLYCRTTSLNLAALYFREGAWQEALDTSLLAIRAGERCYQASFSSEGKMGELHDNAALYQRAAFSAIQCGNLLQGILLLEQGKTRQLMETLRLGIKRPTGVPQSIWQAFEDTAHALRIARQEEHILAENNRAPMSDTQIRESLLQAYQAYGQKIQALNANLDHAITGVRLYAADFLKNLDEESLQKVLSQSQEEALIAFCITEQGSLGIVMSSQSQQLNVVKIETFKQADLDRVFDEWHTAYRQREKNQRSRDEWEATMTRTLETLGTILLAPILSTIPAAITRLTFLPAGQLFLFPLHATPLPGEEQQCTGDRYEVRYASSVDVLAITRARAAQEVEPTLYTIINPTPDTPLLFAPFEGQALDRLFERSQKVEGRQATRARVISDIQGRSYLHFACHGGYNWEEPAASGIKLADGLLTLADLQKGLVDLSSTRLVTLSACETGISDVIQGSPYEYVGVPAGFLLSGVPCVISSLWSVPDISTMLLMERFYQNHRQKQASFAAALTEAQSWLRRLPIGRVIELIESWNQQASPRVKNALSLLLLLYHHRMVQDPTWCPFSHPYYWAAFTVNGS